MAREPFRLLPTLGFGVLWLSVMGALYSGLDWPTDYRLERALWPWKTGWFMFHSHDGWNRQLEVSGITSDQQEIVLDLVKLFPYPVNQHSHRYNEISRNTKSMLQLADYICAYYQIPPTEGELPNAAVSKRTLKSLTVYDLTWPAHATAGPSLADSKSGDRQKKIYLQNFSCEA